MIAWSDIIIDDSLSPLSVSSLILFPLTELYKYLVAVQHFNKSTGQDEAVKLDGSALWQVSYLKYANGEQSLKALKTPCTRGKLDIDDSSRETYNAIMLLRVEMMQ